MMMKSSCVIITMILYGLLKTRGLITGFTGMNDVGSFRSRNKTKAGLSSSTNRLGDHMNFSSVPSAHSRFMPQSAANVNENFGTSELYSANGHSGRNSNIPNFYNDPNCNNLKRNRDGEAKLLSSVAGLNKQVLKIILYL